MKTFLFIMYIKTGAQEYEVGRKTMTAKDYDTAKKSFDRLDLPYHTFAIVKCTSNQVAR